MEKLQAERPEDRWWRARRTLGVRRASSLDEKAHEAGEAAGGVKNIGRLTISLLSLWLAMDIFNLIWRMLEIPNQHSACTARELRTLSDIPVSSAAGGSNTDYSVIVARAYWVEDIPGKHLRNDASSGGHLELCGVRFAEQILWVKIIDFDNSVYKKTNKPDVSPSRK